MSEEFSPPITTRQYLCNGAHVALLSDHELPGGTKQRGAVPWVAAMCRDDPNIREIVYAGPNTGLAQVAIAMAARAAGIKATIFIPRAKPLHPLSARALEYGANLRQFKLPLSALQTKAAQYARKMLHAKLLPFGMSDPTFIDILAEQIRSALPREYQSPERKSRVWLPCGSATLLRALSKIWPESHFLCVQVGKWIRDADIAGISATVFNAPEPFNTAAELQPPYPTVVNYDAKVWQFALARAEHGDIIWNVGTDGIRIESQYSDIPLRITNHTLKNYIELDWAKFNIRRALNDNSAAAAQRLTDAVVFYQIIADWFEGIHTLSLIRPSEQPHYDLGKVLGANNVGAATEEHTADIIAAAILLGIINIRVKLQREALAAAILKEKSPHGDVNIAKLLIKLV